ncbi:MAG: hypothetical protein Q9174_004646 [Haloplaca sp. 1 TL-2023]
MKNLDAATQSLDQLALDSEDDSENDNDYEPSSSSDSDSSDWESEPETDAGGLPFQGNTQHRSDAEVSDASPPTSCSSCHKTSSDLGSPLLRCAKCRSTYYCSKTCQTTDWKTHKRLCGKNSLDGLPEKDVYTHLIDAYRLRIEDEYTFTGDVSMNSLYGGGNPIKDFRRFLNKAEKKTGILPSWWSKAKRTKCEEISQDEEEWSYLGSAVEKSDIQEHYKNPLMPMQLRLLAEQIYGNSISPW